MAPDVTADNSDNDAGLVIFRASRLEALVPPLRSMLQQTRPESVLAPQTVVAAHPGMKQWLTGALAREAGPAGIVANLEVILPSTWLDRVAGERLGAQAVKLPAWQRAHLRWTVHDLLRPGHAVPGLTDARVQRYLASGAGRGDADAADSEEGADAARRRFQLADRLAGLYSQYLIYRPDWLRAWEGGQFRFATARQTDPDAQRLEAELLAPLWQALKSRLGPHRADAVDALVTALGQDVACEPLHVFGLSHLAPRELEVLRAWARRAPVSLYVPDPCREYWGGLVRPGQVDELRAWTVQEKARIDNAGMGDWFDTQGHPLLARWGRLGQHFFAALAEGEVREDMRHGQDEEDVAPTNLLQRLQSGIRRLQPSLMADAVPEDDQGRRAWQQRGREDASLRLHSCHTRLRELEVLRDALLDAVEHDGVRAGGIVVMAPDITAYAPLIPAVFGEPGSPRERVLPYHLSDVPIARAHRLFSTFTRLLDLGSSRATTPEIADLLAVPEVALRLGLGGDARDALLGWLERSRVAWALDGAHRAAFAAPAIAEHTFSWAMDRLLAGYVMADAPDDARSTALELPDNTRLLPLAGVQGPATGSLGALDRLLCELQRWRDLAVRTQPASAWAEELQQRIDGLMRADPDDGDAVEALKTIGRTLAQLAAEPAKAGLDPDLHFAVVRELLLDTLGSVPERQRFLMGGITFCGMVPQRAIPFDMVCVLGLNDGEFPRSHRDGGLDLMARVRRLGDRDVRSDDRYLFLETVMSARKRLHLSWIGQDVRDGSARNPAPPLAELITALDHAAGTQHLSLEHAQADRPWWVWHPLQPFDGRYFDGRDAALYSYSNAFARQDGHGHRGPRAFVDGAAGTPDPLPVPLSLPAFARFFKRPAEDLLARRLQLDLGALDGERLPASEPLDERLDRLETIARRVFFAEALPAGFADDGSVRWSAASMPDWVAHAGLLPPGDLGRVAWRNEANAVLALLAATAAHGLGAAAARGGGSVEVDLAVPMANGDTARIHGVVEHLFPDPVRGGHVLLRAFPKAGPDPKKVLKHVDELDYGDLVRMFIEWSALRLHGATQLEPTPIRLAVLALKGEEWDKFGWQAWDQRFMAQPQARADMLVALRRRLAALLGLWQHAAAEPPVYLPGVAWKARRAWHKALDEMASGDVEPDALAASTGASEQENAAALSDADPGVYASTRQAAWAAAAKAAHEAMDGGWNGQGGGARTHAPGYNRLLARGTDFRLDDDGAPSPGLQRLLAYAEQLHHLIRLATPTTAPGRSDD